MRRIYYLQRSTRLSKRRRTSLGLVMAFHSPHLPLRPRKMFATPSWVSCPASLLLHSCATYITDMLPGCMSRFFPSFCFYFSENSFRYTPISEEDLHETIFRHIYDPEPNFEPLSSQNIGVFCMVLAIGILTDLDKPAHSAEAMYYYHLARAALSINSILEEQTIAGIQALVSGSYPS